MNTVYEATLDVMPGAIFCVQAGLYALIATNMLVVLKLASGGSSPSYVTLQEEAAATAEDDEDADPTCSGSQSTDTHERDLVEGESDPWACKRQADLAYTS
jgi:hypothetical protein